jgi:hypothetical protein
MQTQTPAPVAGLTLDIKKHRFRISGKTFQLIETPEYFRLLVNPLSMDLVIEECSEYTKGAYQLSKVPQHRGCYEMTSKSLMNEIILCAGITTTNTIRLEGRRIRGQNALFFHFIPNPVSVSDSNSEKEG